MDFMEWEDVDCMQVVGLCEHVNETSSGTD